MRFLSSNYSKERPRVGDAHILFARGNGSFGNPNRSVFFQENTAHTEKLKTENRDIGRQNRRGPHTHGANNRIHPIQKLIFTFTAFRTFCLSLSIELTLGRAVSYLTLNLQHPVMFNRGWSSINVLGMNQWHKRKQNS